MKKIAISAFTFAFASAVIASMPETRFVEIASPNDVHAIESINEWRRGADTNGIMVTVCVGIADVALHGGGTSEKVPISRDLEFDAEGRLVRVSRIGLMKRLVHSDTDIGELLSMVGPIDRSVLKRLEKARKKAEADAKKRASR